MSNYLKNLLARHNQSEQTVQPRLRSRFEPEQRFDLPFGNEFFVEESDDPSKEQHESEAKTTSPTFPKSNLSVKQSKQTIAKQTPRAKTKHPEELPPSRQVPSIESQLASDKTEDQQGTSTRSEKTENRPFDRMKKDYPFVEDHQRSEPLKPNPLASLPSQKKEKKNAPAPFDSSLEKRPEVEPKLNAPSTSERPFHQTINQRENRWSEPDRAQKQLSEIPKAININIGRIEVRAISEKKQPKPQQAKKTPSKPKMTLEDFLKKQVK